MTNLPIDNPPTLSSRSDVPSDEDIGFNDPWNIVFVNMEAEGLPERLKERQTELETMLLLTHQLVTIHCGIQVKNRKAEGQLPADGSGASQWERAAYRVKVLKTYFQNGIYPWLVYSGQHNTAEQIVTERNQFHWRLLANMLSGITVPRPVATSLEVVFQRVSSTIKETENAPSSQPFLGLIQAITYDEN
ncbi:hypothetical protein HC256_004385 [Beauveria bassiana]|nr:hypothetical protein HC256_004385 [Beauveria bassiana]